MTPLECDEALPDQALAGSAEAFTTLYRRRGQIFRFACQMGGWIVLPFRKLYSPRWTTGTGLRTDYGRAWQAVLRGMVESMKTRQIFVLLPLLLSSLFAAPAWMPVPASVAPGSGRLKVDGSFRVLVKGQDVRLRKAALRTIRLLATETGIPFDDELGIGGAPATLTIDAAAPGLPIPALEEDESYHLEVTPTGARIDAPTVIGAIRGLATFGQMVESGPDGFFIASARVEDRPRFRWRALLIDIARHWMPMDVLKRNLDGMAAVKLNVLHLHISDHQGFRIESKRFPRLQQMGSDGHFYTQQQMREVIAYARDRGIRVLPEFDMPGHTGAWFPGYPELAAAEGPHSIVRIWHVHDPCLDPTREETYRFLDGFIGEMAALFPDAFFHTGGDEVNGVQWNANSRIVEFRKAHGMKDHEALQAYFNKRVQQIVSRYGKIMVGWDEILNPDLPRSVVIQSWRGPESEPLTEVARRGYRSLQSFGYYLDDNSTAAQYYAVDPLPAADAAKLSPAEQQKILGGEACMWSEYVSAENADIRIWPRVAAIAERLWSPASVSDPVSMYARLRMVSRRLSLLGLTHRSTQTLMVERMAGAGPVEPVRTLAAVVAPGSRERMPKRRYTNTTPYNRMVDTAAPESMEARLFGLEVDALLAGRGDPAAMERKLLSWRGLARRALPQFAGSSLLAETIPMAESLSATAALGLEALSYFRAGKPAPAAWYQAAQATLARAQMQQAELRLMIVPPVKKLVDAVGPASR